MKVSIAKLPILALAATFCIPALAQTRFCVGGDLDHLSPAQKSSCSAKMDVVRKTALALHAPSDWHFVVVCGESGWESYASFATGSATALDAASASTNLEQKETFFREGRLSLENPRGLTSIVAREIAMAVLHTEDKVAIDRQLENWEKQSSIQTGF